MTAWAGYIICQKDKERDRYAVDECAAREERYQYHAAGTAGVVP